MQTTNSLTTPQTSSQDLETNRGSSAIWLWQSGADPWAEKDPSKFKWEPYSQEISLIIEKALLLNHPIADVGEYIIDLNRMLQVNKQNNFKIRRIHRQTRAQSKNRFMVELPQPRSLPKEQKTINTAFGDVRHFLNYITKRTYESYILYLKLKRLPLDTKKAEYPDIIEKVINCVKKGADTRDSTIKSRDSSANTNFHFEAECIVEEINKNSDDLGTFLKTILKIYTMETFICYWLNELLRSENWEEINILTPYLVCLTFTFQLEGYMIPLKKKEPSFFSKVSSLWSQKNSKFILYRGTALIDEHLAIYKDKKIDYFSWNGVTSTSRSKEQSMNFINHSLMAAKRQNTIKHGVLFVIETELSSIEDCHGMIDVSANSRFPQEQEVILAPGTVFRVIETKQIDNNICQINLEIQKKLENEKEAIAILGALQQKIIRRDDAKIHGLSGKELLYAIQLLEGNQYIESIEIKNIKIDDHLAQMISSMFKTTTKVQSGKFNLLENEIIIDSLRTLNDYFADFVRVGKMLDDNDVKFVPPAQESQRKEHHEKKIKYLYLGEAALQRYAKNHQFHTLTEQIRNEVAIESLLVHIEKAGLDEKAQTDLMACMNSLPILDRIEFDFRSAVIDLDQTFDIMQQNFTSMNLLTKLKIQAFFMGSRAQTFTDKAIKSLCKILKQLPSLKAFDMRLGGVGNFEGEGFDWLSSEELIKPHTSPLQEFGIYFGSCGAFTNQGLINLSKYIKSFPSLQKLSVEISTNKHISNEGLNNLAQTIETLPFLTYIHLQFGKCPEISNEGVASLMNAIKRACELQELILNFSESEGVSDQGVGIVCEPLISLPNLHRLSLNFGYNNNITDLGLVHVENCLDSLPNLKNLRLDFYRCPELTQKGWESFERKCKSISTLTSRDINGPLSFKKL